MKIPFRLQLLLVAALLFAQLALGGDVAVRAGNQTGVGILRKRAESCFVVTPLHVVGETVEGIRVTEVGGRTALATVYERRPPDLVVLKVDEQAADFCAQSSWREALDVNAVLKNNASGIMTAVTEAGSVARFEVSLEGFNSSYVDVRPRYADRRFIKGHSGSAITINGNVMALLLDVIPPRDGRALRIDRASALLADIFEVAQPVDPCQKICESSTASLAKVAEYDGDCDIRITKIQCRQTETVYALPPKWPTHKYLHIVRWRVADVAPSWRVTLADSAQKGASDLRAYGFGSTAGTILLRSNAICQFEVNAEDSGLSRFGVQVKACRYTPFGQ